jgi:DamX protein
MDDLTPEDDLKPDTSDRRPTRSRKPPSSAPKLAVSRQHLMIGVGILVLLLLIAGIGSALKAPTQHEASQQSNGPKDINLSGAGNDAAASAPPSAQAQQNTAQTSGDQQPKSIGLPPISSTPTDAQPQPDNGQPKERVDLPGDMSDALSSQQGQVNAAAQDGINAGAQSLTSLPTAPATVDGAAKGSAAIGRTPQQTHKSAQAKPTQSHVAPAHKAASTKSEATKPVATTSRPATSHAAKETTKPVATASSATGSGGAIKSAPGSHFTLQLSGASQSNSLNAFAKQAGLKNYLVYQTSRDGKPWYVLVSGNYASSAEAKSAISSLPADVQAKKPWVKPVHQVQQDLKK